MTKVDIAHPLMPRTEVHKHSKHCGAGRHFYCPALFVSQWKRGYFLGFSGNASTYSPVQWVVAQRNDFEKECCTGADHGKGQSSDFERVVRKGWVRKEASNGN